MSREAFGEEALVYANLNNWGGRFITPGPFDNTSRIFFVSHASVAAMLGATQWSRALPLSLAMVVRAGLDGVWTAERGDASVDRRLVRRAKRHAFSV